MALLTAESRAKTTSFIAPKGGKQSVRLYAVRLLGRWRCPLHPRSPAAAQQEKAGTPMSRRMCPRVRLLPLRSATITAEEEKRAVGPRVATCDNPAFPSLKEPSRGQPYQGPHHQRNEYQSRIKTLSGSRLPGPVYTDRQRRSGVTVSVIKPPRQMKTC